MVLAWWASCQVPRPSDWIDDVGQRRPRRATSSSVTGTTRRSVGVPARTPCRSVGGRRPAARCRRRPRSRRHRRVDAGPGPDDGPGEHGAAGRRRVTTWTTTTGSSITRRRRDVDHHRVDGEGVVEEGEVARVGEPPTEQRLALGVVGRPTEGHDVVADRRGQRGQHPLMVTTRPLRGPRPSTRRGSGRTATARGRRPVAGRCRPDGTGRGRAGRSGCTARPRPSRWGGASEAKRLGRGRAATRQPGGPGQGGGDVGGEGGQDRDLSRIEARSTSLGRAYYRAAGGRPVRAPAAPAGRRDRRAGPRALRWARP